jgi:hypothetical protein
MKTNKIIDTSTQSFYIERCGQRVYFSARCIDLLGQRCHKRLPTLSRRSSKALNMAFSNAMSRARGAIDRYHHEILQQVHLAIEHKLGCRSGQSLKPVLGSLPKSFLIDLYINTFILAAQQKNEGAVASTTR